MCGFIKGTTSLVFSFLFFFCFSLYFEVFCLTSGNNCVLFFLYSFLLFVMPFGIVDTFNNFIAFDGNTMFDYIVNPFTNRKLDNQITFIGLIGIIY